MLLIPVITGDRFFGSSRHIKISRAILVRGDIRCSQNAPDCQLQDDREHTQILSEARAPSWIMVYMGNPRLQRFYSELETDRRINDVFFQRSVFYLPKCQPFPHVDVFVSSRIFVKNDVLRSSLC